MGKGGGNAKEMEDEDDNFVGVNDDDAEEDDDFFSIRKPTSWGECISMVFKQDEERLLMNQNPDGLLYLTFLKQSGFVFLFSKSLFT